MFHSQIDESNDFDKVFVFAFALQQYFCLRLEFLYFEPTISLLTVWLSVNFVGLFGEVVKLPQISDIMVSKPSWTIAN